MLHILCRGEELKESFLVNEYEWDFYKCLKTFLVRNGKKKQNSKKKKKRKQLV